MKTHLVWAEIDMGAITHNIKEIKQLIKPSVRLMVVVKANGYGHGAAEIAERAIEHGASHLGVARLEEAIQLRQAGISSPIVIFGSADLDRAVDLVNYNLTQTVSSEMAAKVLSSVGCTMGRNIKIHVKLDTGMGRVGLLLNEFDALSSQTDFNSDPLKAVQMISQLPGCDFEGVYTHFATADSEDKSYINRQLSIFQSFLSHLNEVGIKPLIRHAANSAATIDHPEAHFDMVRVGISTYGLYPSEEVNRDRVKLKPAMQIKAKIIQLKQVPKDYHISYGITYKTPKNTVIATIPIGYADGFSRHLSSQGYMLVRGKKAPIVGRVCMDLTMIDVGHIDEVAIDDEVIIIGKQEDEMITAEDMAETLKTINYEVVSTITDRVPRVYLN